MKIEKIKYGKLHGKIRVTGDYILTSEIYSYIKESKDLDLEDIWSIECSELRVDWPLRVHIVKVKSLTIIELHCSFYCEHVHAKTIYIGDSTLKCGSITSKYLYLVDGTVSAKIVRSFKIDSKLDSKIHIRWGKKDKTDFVPKWPVGIYYLDLKGDLEVTSETSDLRYIDYIKRAKPQYYPTPSYL